MISWFLCSLLVVEQLLLNTVLNYNTTISETAGGSEKGPENSHDAYLTPDADAASSLSAAEGSHWFGGRMTLERRSVKKYCNNQSNVGDLHWQCLWKPKNAATLEKHSLVDKNKRPAEKKGWEK